MASRMPSGAVVDFQQRAVVLRQRQASEAISQIQLVLADLRKDMQLIAIVEEMSATTLAQPIASGSEVAATLAKIDLTLREISNMLPACPRTGPDIPRASIIAAPELATDAALKADHPHS